MSVTTPDLALPLRDRPWGLATLWLILVGGFFFVSYLGSLELVALRDDVPVLVFGWERHIPFLAWTIMPYWSIDLFYALAFFLCLTRAELFGLVRRLLSAQIIAVTIFLIAPLKLTSTIPAETGIFAPFFAALEGVVGKPYNMAPSLHIALLVILWAFYARHVPRRWHWVMHLWALLIGVSVLTANQHHVFDVPTGAALGLFCVWLWPADRPSPLGSVRLTRHAKRLKLSAAYAFGAAFCIVVAIRIGGWTLWLLWPALSLTLVSLAYLGLGPTAFQKGENGRMSLAARWLFWPYLLAARVNAWAWTRGLATTPIAPGIRLGRLADSADADTVLDLSAELPSPGAKGTTIALPMLDLVAPSPAELARAAQALERLRGTHPSSEVLVCCALGYSRSAAVVAVWLAAFGGHASAEGAIAHVRARRQQVVLGSALTANVSAALRTT